MGIRTLGAWICGWDYHNHANMYEDLNYFIACKPTYQQLTRLSPFPGTELWRKLSEHPPMALHILFLVPLAYAIIQFQGTVTNGLTVDK